MRRGKYTFPAALFLYGILTLNMTNVILNEVKNLPEGWYFSD